MGKSQQKAEKSTSVANAGPTSPNGDESGHIRQNADDLPDIDLSDLYAGNQAESTQHIALPAHVAGSGSLEALVDQARDYARKATAENTNLAYKKDWANYASWCRRRGANQLEPDPQLIGLYITELASPQDGCPPLAVSTIERRLSGLAWNYKQRGLVLDRRDRHIASVLAGIVREHGKPPQQKEPISPEELLEMVATLTFGLRDMRDRAILLIGYAGGLRRSEIVGLDLGRDQTEDGKGWVEIEDGGAIIIQRTKTGWKEAEIARGSSEQSCPVHALGHWLHFAKIAHGPIFRQVLRNNSGVQSDRLSDKHVARLIKKTMLEAGLRSELSDKERMQLFSGHSLRAGLASYAQVDERHIQKQLGHASAEMTRRYQRKRDRFAVNLTKAVGL